MKSKILRILTTIGILSLLPIFMGQDERKIFDILFDETINKEFTTPPGRDRLYITHLSFMDAETQTAIANSHYIELINNAFVKVLYLVQKANDNVVINETGHIVPNTDKNVNNLINIAFDPGLTKTEKINKIIDEFMNPYQVDMIITGQYIDDAKNPKLSIRPLVISKAGKKIITRNLQFTKEDIICRDLISKEITLCQGAYDQIAQAFLELLEEL